MTSGHDDSADPRDFDASLRRLHTRALAQVPSRTLLQLRPRRPAPQPTAKPRLPAWPLAATCAVALVAGGLLLRHPTPTRHADVHRAVAPAAATSDSEPADVYATLDESPELYLWLASNDSTSLVME